MWREGIEKSVKRKGAERGRGWKRDRESECLATGSNSTASNIQPLGQ